MKRKQRSVKSEVLKVRAYPVLVEAVESGVAYGFNRAAKYEVSGDGVREYVEQAVLDAICEKFEFELEKD